MNATMMLRPGLWCALAAVGVMLAGCGSSSEDELQAWLSEERAQAKPRIVPIPPSKPFVPQNYLGDGLGDDAFSPQRLLLVLRNDGQAQRQAALKSELDRRREPLEAYPLDVLTFVGTLSRAGRTVALIKADNLLFQVERGARLGQNNGQVVRITESEVSLREVVQDAAGDWTERPATLQLQERTK